MSKTHPLVYWLSLFFGILASIISLAWVIQVVGTTIYINGVQLLPFIDNFLFDL